MPEHGSNSTAGCGEFRATWRARLARREFLQIGGIPLLSSGLLALMAGRSQGVERRARIKSCLLLFQAGGVSRPTRST